VIVRRAVVAALLLVGAAALLAPWESAIVRSQALVRVFLPAIAKSRPPTPTPDPAVVPAPITAPTPVATPRPLPTAVPPSPRPLERQVLIVPQRFRRGVFATERTLSIRRGFVISVFAAGLDRPRKLAVSPGGVLFVSAMGSGQVVALPDVDRDGEADALVPFATGLVAPHGLAFVGRTLYVAETGRVLRFFDDDGDLRPERSDVVIDDIPPGGGHSTRTLAFGPDGWLYVSIGSTCNVCIETDPRRAAIVRYRPDGAGGELFAEGLRNSVGIAFHPRTGELWGVDNGRDWLGDDWPPEELNRILPGRHYGWPRCNGNRIPDPDFGDPAFCAQTEPPVVEMQAHSAPLGLAFLHDALVPPDYRPDVLVGFHGSWNRTVPTGYKIVRVGLEPPRVEDFVTGWLVGSQAWGRPVDVIVGPDGALYVTDDRAGAVYRIVWAF
jgi:glucose/arabinose dehydrogenase